MAQSFQTRAPMHLRIHHTQASERFAGTARIALFASAFYVLVLALCRLLPYGRSLISRSIGETLSNDTFDCALGAFHVIYAEPNAIGIAEIEFAQVAVQMPFAAMLVDTLHAALEDRIVAFNCVGVDDPTHVFADAVIDGLMHPIFFPERAVSLPIIANDESFLGNVGADDREQLTAGSPFHMEAAHAAAASDQRQNGVLVGTSPAGGGLNRHSFDAAGKGFIDLYDLACTPHGLNTDDAHGLTKAMRHEPCSLESDAQGPMKLVARNALLRRAHKVCSLKPIVHRHMASLENGPDFHAERLAAVVALIDANAGALAAHLGNAIDCAAMRANRTVRPQAGFNPGVSSGFAMEGFGIND
jgi:hypothetical protein